MIHLKTHRESNWADKHDQGLNLFTKLNKPHLLADMRSMKYLALFIQLFVFHSTTWATTEIIESSSNGQTYIDPVNNIARINIRSTFRNPSYAAHPPGIECKKLKIVRRETENNCIQSMQVADPTKTCEILRTSVQGFVDCEEIDAAQMTILDPQQCGNPAVACAPASTSWENYTLDLPLAGIREQIRTCSPTHELLVVTDSRGQNASVSSMKDLQQCGRNLSGRTSATSCSSESLRPIDTGDVLWDQENRDEYKIKVSHTPGFYVGDHSHYFFDYAQKKWCYQFKPFHTVRDNNQILRTTATCVTPPVTAHPLEFNRGSEHITKGIVRLELDSSGQPIATVGQPSAQPGDNGRYQLDTTKPVMRVTLSSVNPPASGTSVGRRSTFELVNADGKVRSSMTVSPSMVLGSNLNTPGACSSSPGRYCLNVPTQVNNSQMGENFCRNNYQTLPLSTSTGGLCYSCNGITPGNCDQATHLVQRISASAPQADSFQRIPTSYSDLYNQLSSCNTPVSAPSSPSDMAQ